MKNRIYPKRLKKRTVSFSNFKKIVIWITSLSLLIVVVFVTIESAATGAVLARLEEEEINLSLEKNYLTKTLAESTSLTKLGEESENMGFKKPQSILYIEGFDAQANLSF